MKTETTNTKPQTPKASPVKSLDQMTDAELAAEMELRGKKKKSAHLAARAKFETDKDDFLLHGSRKFRQLREELRDLKAYTISEANSLYERMYKMNDKVPRETNSFTLKNEADSVKLTVDGQERLEFTGEAMVHINAIKEIFKEKFAKRNQGLYEILDGLLIKGSKGEYDPKLLAKARNQVRKLGDEILINEFDKLDDCQRVTGTALYCRLYVKNATNKKWEDVSLQFSAL